jgi:hypothetical protein
LRPGVDLILLVRRDLAEADSKDVYPELLEIPEVEIESEPPPIRRQN